MKRSRIEQLARSVALASLSTVAMAAQSQGTTPPTPAAPTTAPKTAPTTAPTAASIESGRELFRANCVRCHGADATGTSQGPNLLPRVKGMSDAAFAGAVLQRYRWSVPAGEAGGESAAREAMLRGLLSRRQTGDTMPAWASEPTVAKGIRSLYDFLSDSAR